MGIGLSNPLHIALIVVVVLLVFGAKRLPEMGRSIGSGIRGFKDEVTGEPERPSLPAPADVASTRSGAESDAHSVR
ncbi:MAG: twin-arginine translocase TatA/TatE family subunit [Solirubrobacterales bacterium]|jgi:sec-independent protein translocase protein TatA|nr:twin-arginine translocase TatA/TatE family subunit [Solirubrobacterales bacterium]MBV9915997.1 twin-arginine translocase TatA/TatE family subunit [Solirubrobacterales bacterium]